MAETQKTFGEELADLFPGRRVTLGKDSLGKDLYISVFPIGVPMIQRFSSGIVNAVAAVTQAPLQRDLANGGKIMWQYALPRILPAVLGAITGDLVTLVADCCEPNPLKFNRIPHWKFAEVVGAWFDENFAGENKLRPWVQAMEGLLSQTLGEKVELWETLSRALSPAVIASMKSSIVGSAGTPIVAGASDSSTTGHSTPVDSSSSDAQSS